MRPNCGRYLYIFRACAFFAKKLLVSPYLLKLTKQSAIMKIDKANLVYNHNTSDLFLSKPSLIIGVIILIKIIIIAVIVFIVLKFIVDIHNAENDYNANNQIKGSTNSPPNYRPSPWTPEWIRPEYRCDGCVYGCQREYINGEFVPFCKKFGITIDVDKVCDDYVENNYLASFCTTSDKFVPYCGHFDKCPFDNKEE